jgi:uncharacterized membrane protein
VARADRRRTRLDQPRVSSSRSLLPSTDPDAFGRLSERIARFLGTGKFLVAQSAVIFIWIIWNIVVPKSARFDAYPFQFLTLVLSLQAAYAAPLILLAQTRQDDRDRANLAQDRDQNAMLTADAEYLTREVASLRVALGDVVTRDFLRAELRMLLEDVTGHNGDGNREERGERPAKKKRKQQAQQGQPPKNGKVDEAPDPEGDPQPQAVSPVDP